jgi:hypothetical protein
VSLIPLWRGAGANLLLMLVLSAVPVEARTHHHVVASTPPERFTASTRFR